MAPTPIVPLRADAATKLRWQAAADREGESLSVWMRSTLDAASAVKPTRGRGPTKAARKETERVARSGLCPHRIGPDQYCSRCDA